MRMRIRQTFVVCQDESTWQLLIICSAAREESMPRQRRLLWPAGYGGVGREEAGARTSGVKLRCIGGDGGIPGAPIGVPMTGGSDMIVPAVASAEVVSRSTVCGLRAECYRRTERETRSAGGGTRVPLMSRRLCSGMGRRVKPSHPTRCAAQWWS